MSTRDRSIAAEVAAARRAGRIRVGVGGWVYEPWRDNFYPPKLSHASELEYLSRRVSALEINATYYRTQSPASFAKWRDTAPEDFVFAVKATRYATNRRVLAEAGESIERFIGSGLVELGPKLGPVVWQFATTKVFDVDDFEAFLKLLPRSVGSLPLRHAMEVRHPSFMVPEYVALARRYDVATVLADSDDYPSFADLSSDFVYARLMRSASSEPTGYTSDAIDDWANRSELWSCGDQPEHVVCVTTGASAESSSRDVFMFFISGAKERAPAAAMALLTKLGLAPPAPT